MYKGKTVAVVVPAYNVAAQILQVLKAVPPFVDWIVVVDDCGTDETSKVLTQVSDPRMVVLKHETNQGVGGAMVTGFQRALNDGAELIVKMDGDGQMDPDYLTTLLDPLEEGF